MKTKLFSRIAALLLLGLGSVLLVPSCKPKVDLVEYTTVELEILTLGRSDSISFSLRNLSRNREVKRVAILSNAVSNRTSDTTFLFQFQLLANQNFEFEIEDRIGDFPCLCESLDDSYTFRRNGVELIAIRRNTFRTVFKVGFEVGPPVPSGEFLTLASKPHVEVPCVPIAGDIVIDLTPGSNCILTDTLSGVIQTDTYLEDQMAAKTGLPVTMFKDYCRLVFQYTGISGYHFLNSNLKNSPVLIPLGVRPDSDTSFFRISGCGSLGDIENRPDANSLICGLKDSYLNLNGARMYCPGNQVYFENGFYYAIYFDKNYWQPGIAKTFCISENKNCFKGDLAIDASKGPDKL